MSLKRSQKISLLKQLADLSNDEEVAPHLDEQTVIRIRQMLQLNWSLNFLQDYQDLENKITNFKNVTEIDELNELYNKNIPKLFSQDSDSILRQISVALPNQPQPFSKNNTLTNIKNNNSSIYDGKQNSKSLSSTYSKFNTLKFENKNKQNQIKRKKSQQKIIFYKIQKQSPKFNKKSQQKKTHSIQKSIQKKQLHKISSKSNLKSKQKSIILKTDFKKEDKKNLRSINCSVKDANFSALKNSSSKNSLLSTHKIKISDKKQSLQNTKRNIKSFSSIGSFSNKKILKKEVNQQNYNGSKQKKASKKNLLNKIKKIKTEFILEDNFLMDNLDCKQEYFRTFDDNLKDSSSKNGVENAENQRVFESSYNDFEQKGYLQEIINEIFDKKNKKVEQKKQLQDQIIKLKQKVLLQNKKIQEINTKNTKIINEINQVRQLQKALNQRKINIAKQLNQAKAKVKHLKKTFTQNKNILNQIVQQQIKQEKQLIQMYQNVIEELKKEIRQQNKNKIKAKTLLEKSQKKLQNKETKFNSTLMSTHEIKNNLTDAFKEWV